MSSVAIVFRKDKLNKKKEAPIHFRIIKDRKVSYISTGIVIPEDHWDEEKLKIKGKHKNSSRLNHQITTRYGELQGEVITTETASKTLTSRQLRNKVYGHKPTNFFTIAEAVLESYEDGGQVGTHDKCQSIVKKLEDYNGSKSLNFQDMDVAFLTRYEKHLRVKLNNKTNTVHKDLKFFRRIFNEAIKRELIEPGDSPFLRYTIKLEKTSRTYLTEDELKKIEDLEMKDGTLIECHKNMFVFACYAGGLRVSDVLKLKWGHLDNDYLLINIKKTKEQIRLKLPNVAQQIINLYKPEEVDVNNYMFPVLENGLNEKKAREFDNAITSATTLINKNLKTICTRAKVEKSVSFHISRHTWATRALRLGVPIEIVSKILGHANIRETMIYAKIVNSEMDKAMDLFNKVTGQEQ